MLPGAPPPRTSPGVLAAALVAIASSVLTVAFGVVVEITTGFSRRSGNLTPDSAHTLLVGRLFWLFIVAVALLGTLTGVEVAQRKNWARVTILVWAALQSTGSFIFMLATIVVVRVMPVPPNVPEREFRAAGATLPLVCVVPMAIGIWWLVLFTRKSVVAQFQTSAWQPGIPAETGFPEAAPGAAVVPKPSCPVPVAVVAGFMIFSGVSSLLGTILASRAPTLIFGYALFGTPGRIWLLATAAGYLLSGIGLFRLKPRGYYLAVGLHGFYLLSTLVNLITPDIEGLMRRAMSEMHLPRRTPEMFDPVQYLFWVLVGSAMFGGALLAILLNYRLRFLEAADEAAEVRTAA